MELTLLPSRRVLSIEPEETILAALLRQNAPISHSCKDGRCGLCRCSLSVPDFSSVGKSLADMSYVLACQTIPNADCLVEIPDPDDILVLPPQIARGSVVAIDSPAERVRRVTLSLNKPLRFAAGQHFAVTWRPDMVRMYSATSLETDTNLVFDIQLHYHGTASSHVENVLKVGDALRIQGPLGATYLRRNCTAPILCIANNTGLGALLALLRDISEAQMRNPVFVYVGFSVSEYVYGEQELQQVTKTLRNLQRSRTVIGGGAIRRGDRLGLLTDVLASDFRELSEYRVYAFGSPHAIDVTCRLLRLKGVAQDRLHAEPFHFVTL